MIVIIIPAYNEEENIGSLLKRIAALGHPLTDYTVLVINDGSVDNTREVVLALQDRMPVRLIDHEVNKGVDQVFRTGFEAALDVACDGDVIVTMEADNTSDLSIMVEMLRRLEEGYDLVLASCYAEEGGVVGTNLYRIVLSKTANALLTLFFPLKGVHTYSSFYRAYQASALRMAHQAYGGQLIEERGFVCMVEVLVKMSYLPIKIVEVPMILQCDLRKGNSKMKVVRTMIGYLRLMIRSALGQLGRPEISRLRVGEKGEQPFKLT